MRRFVSICVLLVLCATAFGQSYRISKLGLQCLLPLGYLTEWCGGTMTVKDGGAITLALPGRKVEMKLYSTDITIGDQIIRMPSAPFQREDVVYISASCLPELFNAEGKETVSEMGDDVVQVTRKESKTPLNLPISRFGNTVITPLHLDAYNGLAKLADKHLEDGVDVRDDQQRTPLHVAAAAWQQDMVKYLLAKGADINAVDQAGLRPLERALQKGKADAAIFLLGKGAAWDGRTLAIAAEENLTPVVRALLEKGAPVNSADPKQPVPLVHAAKKGGVEVINLLLAKGAAVNAIDHSDGSTALLRAVNGDNLPVVKRLLDAGAATTATEANVNINFAQTGYELRYSLHGVTPLQAAVNRGNLEIVQYLLAHGADAKARTADGSSVLHLLNLTGKSVAEIAQALLAAGADANARADKLTVNVTSGNETTKLTGLTPLQMVILLQYKDHTRAVVPLLLAAGAQVNTATDEGFTPLHLAALCNADPAVVTLLLDHGADAAAKTRDGATPFRLARDAGADDIVKLLQQRAPKE